MYKIGEMYKIGDIVTIVVDHPDGCINNYTNTYGTVGVVIDTDDSEGNIVDVTVRYSYNNEYVFGADQIRPATDAEVREAFKNDMIRR